MSIFDRKDFQRIKEKTGGEKISEEIKNKKNQIDESWKNGGKVVTSKSIKDRFFNNLIENKE